MLHCRDEIIHVMGGAWFSLGIQAKERNLCFIRAENLVSHGLSVLGVLCGKL